MEVPKYDGNIHPDEWINDIQKYFKLKNINDVKIAISFVDPIISLPAEIDSLEKLRNALKEDISFTVFKNTNKRLLRLLKYIPERKKGETPKFISKFRKYCYNAEINDIEEQKNYFCHSLPNNNDNYFYNYLSEFTKRKENIKSMNDLIREFEEIVTDELNLIRNESIVALKHVATGKYLSSIENIHYTTGSKSQVAFVSSQVLGPNALWKIIFAKNCYYDSHKGQHDYIYDSHNIKIQHIDYYKYLGINSGSYKSPISEHTEVSCGEYYHTDWKVNHSRLENSQRYLKSNDVVNLSTKKFYDNNGEYINDGYEAFLRSHDIQFSIGNDTFQELVCHNERLGGNDEWCIELIKQD
ncbi:hypothetical protein RhiirA1_446046 [Rhizophagus irregularis]|uniref:MIR domain-containing protein n=4 Tax=Rhizophagus irregularis TaxID=588596 RepID=A0A2N0R3A8_9GLOM|nr:hypothetical protein RirG_100660 [Rhizophagus irregularis DAOM 197198w]PKC57795.1 hypothetical protein RhiirA1_446046 [Rhizophagus irregularis]UZO21202.1 hypothetical protein OCT59_013601 [Rhizophagus irregularis]